MSSSVASGETSASPSEQAVKPVSSSPLSVIRRLGWGVADQGVSSLSNFAMGVVVAKALGPEKFGAFTLAYVTYGVVLNAARGLATDPLLVRHSGPKTDRWRAAVSAATATAAAVGLVCGVISVAVGLLLPHDIGLGFVALGVGLPALMIQDSWRFAFFSSGNAGKAVVNDGVWAVVQLALLAGLLVSGHATVWSCVLAFGGSAAVAAAIGLVQTKLRPQPRLVTGWVRENIDLGGRYMIENVSISGARQMRFVVLGGLISLAAVGQVRAAEMLMGPFLVILMGMSQVAVPEAAHVLRRAPERLGRFCFMFGAAQATSAAIWGVAMLLVLPHGVGQLLLGSLWHPAASVLPAVIAGMVAGGFEVGAAAGVRALGIARRSLRAQLLNSALYLCGGSIGAYLDGARGTCIGVSIATALGALGWWYQLHKARGEYAALADSGDSGAADD